nr:MAG TPA: hypothetical protein [Caudoviricetes sp.]
MLRNGVFFTHFCTIFFNFSKHILIIFDLFTYININNHDFFINMMLICLCTTSFFDIL